MFFVDLIFALVIGFLLTLLFALLFNARGPWEVFWPFLLIVVLGAWVGGVWFEPFGPVMYDVAWLPFVFAGLLFALLLAATTPPKPAPRRAELEPGEAAAEVGLAVFSIFFWVLILGLIGLIIAAYI